MFIYSVGSTVALTWLILIRPNNYTGTSNAICWLLTMSIFVFLPMMLVSLEQYRLQLEHRRRKTMRSYRRCHESASGEISGEACEDETIQYTTAYNRQRFVPQSAPK